MNVPDQPNAHELPSIFTNRDELHIKYDSEQNILKMINFINSEQFTNKNITSVNIFFNIPFIYDKFYSFIKDLGKK